MGLKKDKPFLLKWSTWGTEMNYKDVIFFWEGGHHLNQFQFFIEYILSLVGGFKPFENSQIGSFK